MPNQDEPKQIRAAAYVAEPLKPGEPRPQMEKLIQAASKHPRPFDVVLVYNRSILGTIQEANDAMARITEHGIEVHFVHADDDDDRE